MTTDANHQAPDANVDQAVCKRIKNKHVYDENMVRTNEFGFRSRGYTPSTGLRSLFALISAFFLLLSVTPASAQDTQEGAMHSPIDTSSVRISIRGVPNRAGPKALIPLEVTSITIDATSPDIAAPSSTVIPIAPNQVLLDALITLQVANSYTFTVTAFDALGIARFRGEQAGIDVIQSGVATVKILLRRFDAAFFTTVTAPAAEATGVPISTTIRATFSKPIATTTIIPPAGNFLLTETDSGASVPGAVFYDATSSTAMFIPGTLATPVPLTPGTSYTAQLTTGVREPNANPVFTTDLTWTFFTEVSATAKVFTENFEPLTSVKAVDGYNIQAINVNDPLPTGVIATINPLTILDSEGDEAIGIPEFLGLDLSGLPVNTSTQVAGIFPGGEPTGSQAFGITADFSVLNLGSPMFFLGGKGQVSGTEAFGGGFGTARKTHGNSIPLAGGILSFLAQQTAGAGEMVSVLVNDKDGESFTSFAQTLSSSLQEYAFRISLTSAGGSFLQDFSNLPINAQTNGVPNGLIDEIVSIQFVMFNGGGNNNPATMLVDDVRAIGPNVSVNSSVTLRDNSLELVDAVGSEAIEVTSISNGVATFRTPTATRLASSLKLNLTFEPVSGFGDLTTHFDFSLSSQTPGDNRQLSLKLSPVLIGNTGMSTLVTIPSDATINFFGEDAQGSGIALVLANVGTIATAVGPTISIDPDALASAIAAVLPGNNIDTMGNFSFSASFGGGFLLAPSGSTTCVASSGCLPVTMGESEVTTN